MWTRGAANEMQDDDEYDGDRMVLIGDGNSEHVEHAWRKMGLFGEQNTICGNSLFNHIP